jgi:hypothetical protein
MEVVNVTYKAIIYLIDLIYLTYLIYLFLSRSIRRDRRGDAAADGGYSQRLPLVEPRKDTSLNPREPHRFVRELGAIRTGAT